MKISAITATPINLRLEAPYGCSTAASDGYF